MKLPEGKGKKPRKHLQQKEALKGLEWFTAGKTWRRQALKLLKACSKGGVQGKPSASVKILQEAKVFSKTGFDQEEVSNCKGEL